MLVSGLTATVHVQLSTEIRGKQDVSLLSNLFYQLNVPNSEYYWLGNFQNRFNAFSARSDEVYERLLSTFPWISGAFMMTNVTHKKK